MSASIFFGPYQLEPAAAHLLCKDKRVDLTPKAFALLSCLCQRPGRIVSKEELFDEIWHTRHVSEGVLKNAIQELRQALGDDARAPRYIETVHRRGYRFIAEVNTHAPVADSNVLVGRSASLQRLHEFLHQAQLGRPRVVFISGEAGIGKSTLLRFFSAQLPTEVHLAQGQCVDQFGEGEAYLPVLEALNQLCRLGGTEIVDTLRHIAPSWLAQLPWLLKEQQRQALLAEVQSGSRERMLREFGEFLERWTERHPVVLVLEDLHWSDHTTLDLIAYLARRHGAGRWLLLASYRPVDIVVEQRPLCALRKSLQLHRLYDEISLDHLSEQEVTDYLSGRFPGSSLPAQLISSIYRRTEGLPLYLSLIAEEMSLLLDNDNPDWQSLLMTLSTLPEGLRQLMERQFDRLDEIERRIVEAAAVCGSNFSLATLAKLCGVDLFTADGSCERLVNNHRLFRYSSHSYSPERRRSNRYVFIHAYYQELAYQLSLPSRRGQLHLETGRWFEAQSVQRSEELASELARHFECGHDRARALHYLVLATRIALRRHAPHEVETLAGRALTIIDHEFASDPAYIVTTLELCTALSTAMQITHGFAAPELTPVYDRILACGQALNSTPLLHSILWGLICFHNVRGEFEKVGEYAQRLLTNQYPDNREAALICGHLGKASVEMYRGHFSSALKHTTVAMALFNENHPNFSMAALHPGVLGYYFLSKLLWFKGFPDQALVAADRGTALSHVIGQPFSVVFAQWSKASCHKQRGELDMALECATASIPLTEEHGFILIHAMLKPIFQLARPTQDDSQAGLAEYYETGAKISTYLLVDLINAALMRRDALLANLLLEEAFSVMNANNERYFASQLYRQRAALMLLKGESGVEDVLLQALEIAKEQDAPMFMFEISCDLARLWREQKRYQEAYALLSDAYNQIEEGLLLPALQRAKQQLEELETLIHT
ncbi:MAG: AAA family ATPase [Gammaproteobacteria bacterium]|nr:AAA family ATPase [Gammaproteobacteria bacterium]